MKQSLMVVWMAGTMMSAFAQERRAPAGEDALIPPATPLVACDPYFSIWSPGDRLAGVETTHWTGRRHELTSLVKIDGETYRVMGTRPEVLPALEQTDLTVLPTSTIYRFEGAGIALELSFMTPALPEDMSLLSRPVTYLTYDFKSTDGKTHEVSVFMAASAEVTVNTTEQAVTWGVDEVEGLAVLKMGSRDQQVLAKKGDDIRIDWGYFYLAAPRSATAGTGFATPGQLGYAFAAKGLGEAAGEGKNRMADHAGAGIELKPMSVGAESVSTWLMVAYDDLYSIQFNHKNLRPYWRKDGWDAADLLRASAAEYADLRKRCAAFDDELMADLTALGGVRYAKLSALAYRQCFAAGKFVADDNGQPLQFSKENHSNGCIATSDVFYPMSPQFLLFGPTVAKSFLVPFMEYAKSERWKFPFAPHDLGTYPKANGQVYGGGEETEENQMPVEESGNMLILMAAVAEMEGNADFAERYWGRLEQWAEYLRKEGFDPANQLSTDDFSGHLAHNVNLSAKAICGLGSFAKLCEMKGDSAKAEEYAELAKGFARRWVEEAHDGDHFRLAFDRAGTWSQKYNLIWDRILGLDLFPDEVLREEMDFYLTQQNRYGLPLDNRATYTKLDWILWTATLTQERSDFEALVSPVFLFLNEGPSRTPMTDWYDTITARKENFTARPVVGGVFAQTLYDKTLWAKHAGRDRTRAKGWAAMPDYVPPVLTTVVPNAIESGSIEWSYTTERPRDGWQETGFDAGSWKKGMAGFGTRGTPNSRVRTEWNTPDIWMRRVVELPENLPETLALSVHHDEDVEIFINGVLAVSQGGFNLSHEMLPISPAARATLKPGRNLVAVHCHQTGGGQYIDLGFVDVKPAAKE